MGAKHAVRMAAVASATQSLHSKKVVGATRASGTRLAVSRAQSISASPAGQTTSRPQASAGPYLSEHSSSSKQF